MRVVLFILLILIPMGYASAVFYNNTETIEIGDGELPPEQSPDSTTDTGTSGGPASGWTGGTQTSTGSSGGNQSDGSDDTSPDSGNSGENEDNDPEDDVISALIESGALSGQSLIDGVSGSSLGAGEGAGISIRVIGAKVRQAFANNLNLKDFLNYWRKGSGKASEKDLSLIAASTALRDANVQEISFTASAFEIVYRSRGYLLGFIPWSFPVTVKVIPEATALEERVVIRLPWYSFFVRKFFTKGGLQKDVNEVMVEAKEKNPDPDADENVVLFDAVSEYLRQKVGTVAESVTDGK